MAGYAQVSAPDESLSMTSK